MIDGIVEIAEIQVAVDGSTWIRVPSFGDSGPEDPHFAVDEDRSVVRFGDGEAGRRPDGGATVTVTYRTGLGRAGNVAGAGLRVPTPHSNTPTSGSVRRVGTWWCRPWFPILCVIVGTALGLLLGG
jgi:hypothetical protein